MRRRHDTCSVLRIYHSSWRDWLWKPANFKGDNKAASFNFGPQLRQWVSVFYKDISSCVLNNGHASKHFILERGVRQGCPLSGMLFVIAIEFLAQTIRRSRNIKGIIIQPNHEVKLSQYADAWFNCFSGWHTIRFKSLWLATPIWKVLRIKDQSIEIRNALAWISMSPERRNSQPPAELRSSLCLRCPLLVWPRRFEFVRQSLKAQLG